MFNIDNYKKLENGIIQQLNVNKITYNYDYSNQYNVYNEKSIYFSYLRLGVLLGAIGKIPETLLDVGYGNGDFLKVASTAIKKCYGSDISDYPIPNNCIKTDLLTNTHYDVICFFDSLEHFDDIEFIHKLNCEYIFISVPWCHNYSNNWFLNWYHRKPNEHLWHFNERSLKQFFEKYGFDCIYTSNHEDIIRINNESKYYPNILSCVFKNKNNNHNNFIHYYKNKTVLITGGTGFIGRNIVNELLPYVKNIIIFDRTIKYTWDSDKITYIKGDLLNDTDINHLYSYDFDILFHEAANVDTTCSDEINMVNTNFTAFKKLISLCETKLAKLIYASSAATYGNTDCPNSVGVNEIPLNIYGRSKLMMDNYIRENKDTLKITVIGLRYFNVYGNGETHKNNMMSMVTQMKHKIQNNIDVNLFEYGEQKRDFIYVKDVAKCNLLAGMSDSTNIYNCGYGDSISFNKIFEIIKTYYKSDSKINYIKNNYDFFQNETQAEITDTTKYLKYYPTYDIIKGIYDYISIMNE